MPRVGVPNNAEGANGWEGFGTEQPYGEATKQNRLQQGAPLAGGKLAAGPLGAPQKAKRQAVEQAPPLLPVAPPARPPAASVWQQIAATPGASPLVVAYAEKALRQ